jgi:hypothetical protein
MTVLNTANKIYSGTSLVSKVYAGTNLVWPVGPVLDAVTTAWVNAVVAAGGTVGDPRKTLVNDFVLGLKSDGVWTKFDRLYLFAAENTKSALRDLVKPTVPSLAIGTPTFTTDQGYTTSSSNYLRITYSPGSDAVALAQASAHFSVWNQTSGGQSVPMFNQLSGAGNFHCYPEYSVNNFYARIFEASSGAFTTAGAIGHIIGNRSDSSTIQAYRNGTAMTGSPQSIAADVVVDEAINIYNRKVSAFSIGGSLNSTQALAFYNRLNTYLTTVGPG